MTHKVTPAALSIAMALKGKNVVKIAEAIDFASYQGGIATTVAIVNVLEALAQDALRAMVPPDFTEEQAKIARGVLLVAADKIVESTNADLASNGFPPLERG